MQDEGYISDFSLQSVYDLDLTDMMPDIMDNQLPMTPGFPERSNIPYFPYTLGQENVTWRIKEKVK